MEETLTRFSPEPRAAVHLPLQSGASVMQGDSEETTDRRGDEKDWVWSQAEHFDCSDGCPSVAALTNMV